MAKQGKRRQIGRRPRRNKNQAKKKEQLASCKLLSDHSYAYSSESCSPSDTQSAEEPEPHIPPCQYRGNFDHCECIIHEDVDDCVLAEDSNATFDSDGFSADEYFLLYGTSAQQYQPDDNLHVLTLQNIRQDIVNNKDNEITALGMDFVQNAKRVHVVQFYEHDTLNVKLAVTVNIDLTPTITVHRKTVPHSHPVYNNMVEIRTASDLMILLKSVCKYFVCAGNSKKEFVDCFTGKGNAYIDEYMYPYHEPTIRANDCEQLTLGLRCNACKKYRVSLRNIKRRKSASTTVSPSARTPSRRPNSSMTKEELAKKSHLQREKIRSLEAQNKRLRERIRKSIEELAEMNESSAVEIEDLVKGCQPEVISKFAEGSFQRIFWDEQMKYNECKSKSAMRWHPLIVKWALLIKSKSSQAYQAMKDSGFINLPSERTLYDYSHCVESKLGFVPNAVKMLAKESAAKGMLSNEEPWKAYVGLLQDEIKVKEDLVYCPTTGQLMGYVHLDDISNEIMDFEKGLKKESRDLATSCLVVMVRGLTTNLKFPLAAFSTKGLDGKQINSIMWRTIEILEMDVGLKVLCVTCDGAAQNRAFFEMNRPLDHPKEEPVNACTNHYSDDGRQLYFISDVPHLLKTTRNCFANSGSHRKTRHLWKDGSEILWTHVVNLFTKEVENKIYSKSMLTRAHVDLTSFSQMKVKLAAQVLSEHVATHLVSAFGEGVMETSTFIKHMNKWFDCLNTRHLYEGKETRNVNTLPYTDVGDERFSYLLDTFLRYFEDWKMSVENRPGRYSRDERMKMQLSHQTLDGLKISVRSIVSCVKFLLEQGAPFVLTEKFNQDILEQHFGHYRHKGGACDNPTTDNVRHTMNVLRVVGSTALAPLRGNTKRMSESDRHNLVNSPLPRKKSRVHASSL